MDGIEDFDWLQERLFKRLFSGIEEVATEPLNEQNVFTQRILYDAKSLQAARLELFMETLHRVGMGGRMPRCEAKDIGGYLQVQIYAKYRSEGWRLNELLNKHDTGGRIPAYILN
jgi:hypothetical protein